MGQIRWEKYGGAKNVGKYGGQVRWVRTVVRIVGGYGAGSAWPSPLSPIRHLFYHLENIFWPAGGRSQNRKNKWTFAGDFALFFRIFTVNFQFLDFLFWEFTTL